MVNSLSYSVLAAQMITLLPAYWPVSGVTSVQKRLNLPTIPYKSQLISTLALSCIVALSSTLIVTPSHVVQPYRSEDHIMRTGIWTVHFGIDNGGRDSQSKMKQLIR